MATIHHQSYHHTSSTTTAATKSSRRPRRHSLDYSSLPSSSSTSLSYLRQSTLTNNTSISISSHLMIFSVSSTSTSTTTATTTTTPTTSLTPPRNSSSLDFLERYLAEGNFRQADDETRRLLIVLAGEAAIRRGYVFFSEVQFIPAEELKAIDALWRKFSDDRFGYSVQKKIWKKVNKDFTNFFKKVGWMKKLDTEVEQYNYRSFPSEFIWQLNGNSENITEEESSKNDDDSSSNITNGPAPEGHLPLTNALRGTQLLNMILAHPAFDDDENENEGGKNEGGEDDNQVVVEEVDKKKSRLASLRDRLFKTNYSF